MPGIYDSEMLRLERITHAYPTGASSQAILHDVSLSIPTGQSCAIVGASGSGKSTLLNLMGLLDAPTAGRVLLAGVDMTRAGSDECARVRNRIIGFVFQSFHLLPRLDALDNVALPLLYRGLSRPAARQAAQAQLAKVGLSERACSLPADLSGGQRQRVAIARALVGEPALLLADEPTGNLDGQTARDTIDLLLSLNRERGATLILVTHDHGIANRMERRVEVCDGRIREARHG